MPLGSRRWNVVSLSAPGGSDGYGIRFDRRRNAAPRGEARLASRQALPRDLSGATLHGSLLVVCGDEGARLNVLMRRGDRFEAVDDVVLLEGADVELDAEGLASDGRWVYVIGSHSLVRKKVEPDRTYADNRQRLGQITVAASRDHLFRIELSPSGTCLQKHPLSLRQILENDPILGTFTRLPSKENGVDIEGIAAFADRLWIGFRGPVLRGNYAPVMTFKYETPQDYELVFLDLQGRGIRDLAALASGILVLAGPVGDGDGSYDLYLWDGKDCIPSSDSEVGAIAHLGTIAHTARSKPEGLAVLDEAASSVKLLVVRDGADNSTAELFDVPLSP